MIPVRKTPSNVPAPPMDAIGAPRRRSLSRFMTRPPITVRTYARAGAERGEEQGEPGDDPRSVPSTCPPFSLLGQVRCQVAGRARDGIDSIARHSSAGSRRHRPRSTARRAPTAGSPRSGSDAHPRRCRSVGTTCRALGTFRRLPSSTSVHGTGPNHALGMLRGGNEVLGADRRARPDASKRARRWFRTHGADIRGRNAA